MRDLSEADDFVANKALPPQERPTKPMISVVAPVFREQESLREFLDRTTRSLEDVAPAVEHEIIVVNDGSDDLSGQLAREACAADERIKLIELSRNFGHQLAMTAGLDFARGDAVVTIDSDLQDPPEVIGKLVNEWRTGWDVVYARRIRRRSEPKLLRFFASSYYRLMRALVGSAVPVDVADFRLVDCRVLDELKELREEDRYLRGLVPWLGFRQRSIDYVRDPRFAGDSNYRFFRRIGLAVAGITSFSDRPLRIASVTGAIFTLIGLLLALYIIVAKLTGIGTSGQGYASLIVAVLFFGGVQLLALGLTGEYVARIFRESKERPLYVVYTTTNLAPREVESGR